MPFKETSEGIGKMSMYIDGEPYRSLGSVNSGNNAYGTLSEDGMTLNLMGSCEHGLHGMSGVQVNISMNLVEWTEMFATQIEYNVTPYSEEVTDEEKYVRICINGTYAETGCITFRYFTRNIAAGNFECTFTDENGVKHTVDFGNFDVKLN